MASIVPPTFQPVGLPPSNGQITLTNPVTAHFETFIYANAVNRETLVQRAAAQFLGCDPATVTERELAKAGSDGFYPPSFMVERNSRRDQHVIICGAGPSLAEHAAEWCPQGDEVWGCNSAATFLFDRGFPVTHALTVDQTAEMVNEWRSAPPLGYLLASTVHPHLTEYLMKRDRAILFFHNYVGLRKPPVQVSDTETLSYEDWLYSTLYPACVRVGSGLNAVTRAVDLATYMGFGTITVLGADCALRFRRPIPDVVGGSKAHMKWLRKHVQLHADGGHAMASNSTPVTVHGDIDGRTWLTKPDMMITAVQLVALQKRMPTRLRLIGDTLPNALLHKEIPPTVGMAGTPAAEAWFAEWLKRLPSLTGMDGVPIAL